MKDIGARTVPYGNLNKLNKRYTRNNNESASKLRISLIDLNGEILYSFEERCSYFNIAEFHGELKSKLELKKALSFSPGRYIGKINKNCPSQLYSTGFQEPNTYTKFDITSQKYYGFAFEVNNLDKLKEFKEIKIEYVQK